MVESDPRGPSPQTGDELEEARHSARAAWSLVEADVVRLKEAVRAEVDHVKHLGPRSLFGAYPLPLLAVAAGAGFVVGMRGGRSRATYRAIVRAGPDVLGGAARGTGTVRVEKTLRRKLVETLVLALVSRGAQALADHAQGRIERPASPPRAPREPSVLVPEAARGKL